MINNYTEVLQRRKRIISQLKILAKEFYETTIGSQLKIEFTMNEKFQEPKISVNDCENY